MAAAVFAAIEAGDATLLRQSCTTPSTLEARDEDGRTPLIAAAAEGYLECVNVLLQAGANAKAEDAAGRTAALTAAGEGHADILAELHRRDKSVLWAHTKSGNSALHRAAAYGHAAVAVYLLDAGAAMGERNAAGETPLARASRWGHAELVAELLARGADTKVADASGRLPLDWATVKGHADVVELLQAAAADDAAAEADAEALAASEGTLPGGEADAYYVDEETGETGDGDGEADYGDYAEWGVPVRVEGWMAKKGHFFRNWKNRWFVLDGRSMSYYTREGAAKPQGVINLVDGTDVIIEEKYSKPFCFTVITPAKRFILQAADEDEMAEWIEAIQNNLECCVADGSVMDAGGGDDD